MTRRRMEESRASKQGMLESLLIHTTQLALETLNRRQSQDHLARMRAEADNIRRRLPGWPGETTRKLPSEGSEGYQLHQRLKDLTQQSKELRPRIAAWHRQILRLQAVVSKEKRELLRA